MDIQEKIKSSFLFRYATKNYDPSFVVPEKDERVLLESLNMAPSSFGLQPYHFFIIKNPELKKSIRENGYNQSQFTDSSFLVVVCAKTKIEQIDIDNFINRISEVREQELSSLDGYKNMISGSVLNRSKEDQFYWSSKQAYIALGFLLETAALLQIDATPMEGFDSEAVTNLLNLEERKMKAIAIFAIGKRSAEDDYSKLKKSGKKIVKFLILFKNFSHKKSGRCRIFYGINFLI